MSGTALTELPFRLPYNGNNGFRSYFESNDSFRREDERLKTFENWPVEWLDKHELAMTGMFYTGVEDKTKCYFCDIIIGSWEYGDDPVGEHLRWSSNCALLKRRITNNIPINAKILENTLPKLSYDVVSKSSAPSGIANKLDTDTQLEYPEYSSENVRLQSFKEWPRYSKLNSQQLAEAGFFYTGIGDRVKCFTCGCGLKDWEDDDIPWEQHAVWMSHCHFLKTTKGESYINSVLQKFNKSPLKTPELNQVLSQPLENKPLSSDGIDGDEKLCKICFVNEYNTAFVSCGHVVTCVTCALSVKNCPICRTPSAGVVRLYFS